MAHSLGSLVTRWFIEREGGRKVVQATALVGPPNAGAPWATLQDWTLVGLGAAINGLAALIWPSAAASESAQMEKLVQRLASK